MNHSLSKEKEGMKQGGMMRARAGHCKEEASTSSRS